MSNPSFNNPANPLAVIDDDVNETITADAISSALVALSSGNVSADVFSTFDKSDPEAADAVWSALADSEPVKNHLNKTVKVTGVVVLRVELADEETGEVKSQPRVVFVTADGSALHVTSPVVFRDLRTMIALKGQPSPANPVDVRFEVGGSGKRQYVTLKPARKTGK